VVGGKGGGRKDMAQAGGNDPTKLGEALTLGKKLALEKLS
jgi:alanyl-tRNA synthetase